MGHKDHEENARGPVSVFVLTVSDTRDESTDESGALILMEGCLRTNILTGSTPMPSEAIVEACKVAWEAEPGYHRSEFLIDLLASMEVAK